MCLTIKFFKMKKLYLMFLISGFFTLSSFSSKQLSKECLNLSVATNQQKPPKVGDSVDVVYYINGTYRIINVKIHCLQCLQCASIYAYAQAGDGSWWYIHTDYSSSTGWSGIRVDGPKC